MAPGRTALPVLALVFQEPRLSLLLTNVSDLFRKELRTSELMCIKVAASAPC
jgi:hypothetical protein